MYSQFFIFDFFVTLSYPSSDLVLLICHPSEVCSMSLVNSLSYKHTHTHSQIYTHTHIHSQIYSHTHLQIHTHTHTHTHIRSRTFASKMLLSPRAYIYVRVFLATIQVRREKPRRKKGGTERGLWHAKSPNFFSSFIVPPFITFFTTDPESMNDSSS